MPGYEGCVLQVEKGQGNKKEIGTGKGLAEKDYEGGKA
jgi:hypothetical protein